VRIFLYPHVVLNFEDRS